MQFALSIFVKLPTKLVENTTMAVTVFYLTLPLYFLAYLAFLRNLCTTPFPYRFTKDVFSNGYLYRYFGCHRLYHLSIQSVILAILVAFILSYAINPLVQKLRDKAHIRRWVAILLVYLSTGLMIGLILWWLIPLVWSSYNRHGSMYRRQLTIITIRCEAGCVLTPIRLPAMQVRDMSKAWSIFSKKLQYHRCALIFTNLMLSGMNVINVAGIVVFGADFDVLFLYNWDERLVKMRHMIPNRYIPSVYRIAKESDEALMSFIKGQLLVMVLLLGMVYAVQLQLIGLKVGLIIRR